MGRKRCNYYISILTFLSFILILTAFHPADGKMSNENENGIRGPLDPVVWIELDHEVIEIDVDIDLDRAHYVTGTVYCEIPLAAPPSYQVSVEISGTMFSFGVLFFRGYESQEFQGPVVISRSTSAYEPQYYSYWGTWKTENPQANGEVAEQMCKVWALPFGDVKIASVGDLEIKENNWKEFDVPVENHGNCHADVTLDISSEEDLEIRITPGTMQISEKTFDTFSVRIKAGPDSPDEGQIKMTATSSVTGSNMKDVYVIYYQKDQRLIGPFTAPWVIGFLSSFSFIVLTTLAIIFWRHRRSLRTKDDTNT
jgi:hypothetical protein